MSSIWVKDERRRIAADEDRGENSLEAAERAELLRLRTQVAEGWVDVPLDLTADRNVDQQGPWWFIGSGCQAEFEAGEVAGAGPVEWVAVPPGVESDQVQGDGGVDVIEMGLGQAPVAGMA